MTNLAPLQQFVPGNAPRRNTTLKVFVSYSSIDRKVADAVVHALESQGIACWIAHRDITPGTAWAAAIMAAINSCRTMVLILSANSNQSPQVAREAERAADKDRRIITFQIDNSQMSAELEYFLSRSQQLDATALPLAAALQRLVDATADNPSLAPQVIPAPPPRGRKRKPSSRKSWLPNAIAMAVMACACVSLGWLAITGWRGRTQAESPPGPRTITNSVGMRLIELSSGEFLMGTPDSEAGRLVQEHRHLARIARPYFLGSCEVTVAQFSEFARARGTQAEREGFSYDWSGDGMGHRPGQSWLNPGFTQRDDHPVVHVSWNDANEFCKWLGEREGRSYRLPTEAEWEYACRAGQLGAYPWGNSPDGGRGFANVADRSAADKIPDLVCVTWDDGVPFTAPVGRTKPNLWGLHDMIGNVSEWCLDEYVPYAQQDGTIPANPAPGSRVVRGGSWCSAPRSFRMGGRRHDVPEYRSAVIGFRLVLEMANR